MLEHFRASEVFFKYQDKGHNSNDPQINLNL